MDGDNLVGGLRIVVRGKQEVDVEGEDWKVYVLQLVVSHSFNLKMMRIGVFVFLFSLQAASAFGFVVSSRQGSSIIHHQREQKKCIECAFDLRERSFILFSEEDSTREERLASLGYSAEEISSDKDEVEDQEVKVVVIDDVDPVTLTALGFAAIALNFLVFANMGDGGIAGIIAQIQNALRY